jgi:aminoglycoside/choline kinase family phosphotransferase
MSPQSEFQNPEYHDMIGFVREALGLSESVVIELFPLEGRGSDRAFFRLRWSRNDSVILVHYDPKRVENTYYADIAAFLVGIDVLVPKLIRHDSARCLIVMEDLGDTDLWSLRENPWEVRRSLYQKTLTLAHRLHSFPESDFPSSRVMLMEGFGPDLYRWEQDYFRHHFVRDVCGIKLEPSLERELEVELSRLAERLMATKRSLVHRDLQSQNVMVRNGEPFFIDFQGMRLFAIPM